MNTQVEVIISAGFSEMEMTELNRKAEALGYESFDAYIAANALESMMRMLEDDYDTYEKEMLEDFE